VIFIENFYYDFLELYFVGWKESTHSLWKKMIWWCFKIFSWLHRKHSILYEENYMIYFQCLERKHLIPSWGSLYDVLNIFMVVGKEIIQPSNLNGQATGCCWGTNLRAINSVWIPNSIHGFWIGNDKIPICEWRSLLGGPLHLLLNNRRDVT
jgi:hypothetical protein